MKIAKPPAGLDAEAPSFPRYPALLAITLGYTAEEVRTGPAATGIEADDKQIADEIDYLAAHDVTRRVASRAVSEHDQSMCRRIEDERVAQALLRQEGPAAPGICRRIASTCGPRDRGSWLKFAAAAERLLAGQSAARAA
jgi:hypothetical protein